MTYYGRWTYKYEEMARRGAAGALVIHETAPAAYGWETVKNSNTGPVFDVQRDDPRAAHVPASTAGYSVMPPPLLLQQAGLKFDELKARRATRELPARDAPGRDDDIVSFSVKREQVVSKNIMAVLPGTNMPANG